jgi:ComF family protein
MKYILSIIKNIFFPPACISCRKDCGSWLCNKCETNIVFFCKLQKYNYISFSIFTLFFHSSSMRKLLHGIKYNYYCESATFFGPYIKKGLQIILKTKSYCIVPVPISSSRKRERGFDHIIQILGKQDNLLYIKRVHYKNPQMKLNKQERKKNVKGAFKCDQTLSPDINYVIFDDVVTTGSTMNEIFYELKKCGAKNIVGIALSRGL